MADKDRLFSEDTKEKKVTKEKLTGAASPSSAKDDGEESDVFQTSRGDAPAEKLHGGPSADADKKGDARAAKSKLHKGETLRERIQHSTATGGLQVSHGDITAGEAYNMFVDNKSWRCCSKSENPLDNPFLTLYLDHEQHESITPAMVKQNRNLIISFWLEVLEDRSAVAENFGGKGQIKAEYAKRVNDAYAEFRNVDGEVTHKKIGECFETFEKKRLREGKERLENGIDWALDDGVFEEREYKRLLDKGSGVGLKKDEIERLLNRELEERLLKPVESFRASSKLKRHFPEVLYLTQQKHQEHLKWIEGGGAMPFTFQQGQAGSIKELIALCDQHGEEAQDYLFRGSFRRWLDGLGKGPLAVKASGIEERYREKQPKGLELFVRALCKETGENLHPQLMAEPDDIDLGNLPVGARRIVALQLTTEGPRRAWGVIEVEGDLPGLEVSKSFDIGEQQIRLQLDTVDVAPGAYEGAIVIQPEGGAGSVHVPVSYSVTPLEVDLNPTKLTLGGIAYGKEASSSVQVACTPPEGQLVGTATLAPSVEGVQLKGKLDGNASALDVNVDASKLQAGKRYKTSIRMNTNVGEINVPVSFRVTLDWKTVLGWTAGLAALCGLLLGGARYALANAEPGLRGWFLRFSEDGDVRSVAAILSVLLLLVVWGAVRGYGTIKQRLSAMKAAG